ncbi:unnamed protein product [Parajaminaea phylloscopi]
MTSTAASPLPIPFSRSHSGSTAHPQALNGSAVLKQQSRALYHSALADLPGKTVTAPSAASSPPSTASISSSVGSSSSSSAFAPRTPTDMPTAAPLGSHTGKTAADNKIKSSAAKRASAKAAAAAKKAATTATTAASTASSSSQASRSGSAGSPTPTPGASDNGNEWVVPQRAKPGRKPSQDEPLTKRQAQNRASQRAFRERKQNHVSTLEAKVAEYEAEKLTRDAKEAEAQRQLREHNAALEAEKEALATRVRDLEALVAQLQVAAASAVPSSSSSGNAHHATSQQLQEYSGCLQAGCRAPIHESVPTTERRKRPLPSRTPSSREHIYTTSSVAYGAPSPTDHISTSRFGAMSIAATSPPFSSGQSTGSLQLTPLYHPTAVGSTSMAMLPSRSNMMAPRQPSPDLMPSNDIDMDRDCGFCTDSTPCLCRGEAVLDLTGMDADDEPASHRSHDSTGFSTPWIDGGVDQLIKIEEEDENAAAEADVHHNDSGSGARSAAVRTSSDIQIGSMAFSIPRRPAVSVSSLLTSRPRSSVKPKLWSTTALNPDNQASEPATTPMRWSTQGGDAAAGNSGAKPSAPAPGSKTKKLWWTQPLSATGTMSQQTSALYTWTPNADPDDVTIVAGPVEGDDSAFCSGDPSNCPACNADPALAAFCEAVGDDGASEASMETSATATAANTLAGAGRRHSLADTGGGAGATVFPPAQNEYAGEAATASGSGFAPSYHQGSSRPLLPARSLTTGSHPHTSSTPYSLTYQSEHGDHAGYSIPDAFRQIRSHPGFPKWQGGLNLLADVVSGRDTTSSGNGNGGGASTYRARGLASSYAASRLAREEADERRRIRHPSVEIVSTSSRQTGLAESGDRDVIHDDDDDRDRDRDVDGGGDQVSNARSTPGGGGRYKKKTPSRTMTPSLAPLSSLSSSGVGVPGHNKRRRLYLENDRVEEALRLLDFGVVGASKTASASAASAGDKLWLHQPASSTSTSTPTPTPTPTPCGDCPCPCPWANGSSGGQRAGESEGRNRSQTGGSGSSTSRP